MLSYEEYVWYESMKTKAQIFGHILIAQEREQRRPWQLLELSGIEADLLLATRRAVLAERFDFAHQQRPVLQRQRQNRAPGVAVVTVDGRNGSRPNATEYTCAVPTCMFVSDHQCVDCRVWRLYAMSMALHMNVIMGQVR